MFLKEFDILPVTLFWGIAKNRKFDKVPRFYWISPVRKL